MPTCCGCGPSNWTHRFDARKHGRSAHSRHRYHEGRNGGPVMCGVIGILLADHEAQVSPELYDGLTILQHRGQDAAGIATSNGLKMFLRKDKGLARDVFGVESMAGLRGAYGVGHVRYPTSGCNSVEEAQPFRNNVPVGFCVAHNGHLSNGQLLRDQLSATRHLNTDSDTELLSEIFGMELAARRPAIGPPVTRELLFQVVEAVMARCRGGYAVTVLINGYGILAFRDPHGVRPLCLGARPGGGGGESGMGSGGGSAAIGGEAIGGDGGIGMDGMRRGSGKMDLAVASESAALTGLGFSLRRDVGAGEAVFLDASTGSVSSQFCSPRQQQRSREEGGEEREEEGGEGTESRRAVASFQPCLFEYVYMARPDSIIDGVPVYAARVAMGLRLAKKIARQVPIGEVDVVVPVPETSRVAAMHCATRLGLPFEEGLTKNRYVGRTFIMPGQAFRRQNVRKKLSAVSCVLQGRSVLLVDDSIVRGTTSREIVRIVKEAGARKVFFCSASPPVRHPNCYGIDLPRQSELLAHGLEDHDIAEAIGADGVDLQDLEDCVSELKPGMFYDGFENSMFTGEYLMPSDMIEGDPADGGVGAGMGMGQRLAPGVVDVI
ncbi:unnamed protein product [Ectocarpus sp. CCAP 1310/34]|nr:unnamed protein product [Ectocarpus sp. CCAP 1310/34]